MKKGDRVSYQGRDGTVEGFMPNGMVDVRFDDASHRVERRNEQLLSSASRANPNPYGRRPRKNRRARRNTNLITIEVGGETFSYPRDVILQWRDRRISEAEAALAKAEHFKQPGDVRREESRIQKFEEASPETLAAWYHNWVSYDPMRKRRDRAEDLVYDERTGEWVNKDWTRIADPKIRERKKREATEDLRRRHYEFLKRERSPGGNLAPLTPGEKKELEWLMRAVPFGETQAERNYAEGLISDEEIQLSRAGMWLEKLQSLVEEGVKDARVEASQGFLGYTEAEGWHPGEGKDRDLLQELKGKREKAITELVGQSNRQKLSNEQVQAAVGKGLLAPWEAEKVLADRAPKPARAAKVETPEDREKREAAERKKQRMLAEADRREAATAYSRSATFRPKSQKELDKRIDTTIKADHAGFFTRPDPPRLSHDRRVYCGNPIDSTAYYLVVDNTKIWTAPFIKWEAVEKLAESDEPLPSNVVVGPFKLKEQMSAGGLVEREVVRRIEAYASRRGKKSSTQAASNIRETELQIEQKTKELIGLSRELEAAGKMGNVPTGRKGIALAVHPRLKPLSDAIEFLKERLAKEKKELEDVIKLFTHRAQVQVRYPDKGRYEDLQSLDSSLPEGTSVRIELPSDKRLERLRQAFALYQARVEHQHGVSIIPIEPRYRKYIRQRKSKYLSARESQPRAEDIGKQPKAGAPGQEPNVTTDYAQIGPDGQLTYYRLSRWKAPGSNLLRRFQAYNYRTFNASREGTLRDAVAAGLGASPEVAEWFILSGAVSTPGARGKPIIRLAPDSEVQGPSYDPDKGKEISGTKISVWLPDKANNPFFSWVPTVVPFVPKDPKKLEEGAYAVCLSAEEKEAQSRLRMLKLRVQQLNGALNSVRYIFRKLAEDPGSLKPEREDPNPRRVFDRTMMTWTTQTRPYYYSDVRRALSKLASSYAGLYRWFLDFASAVRLGNPSALLVQKMLKKAAKPEAAGGADFALNSLDPYWVEFTSGTSLMRGLVGGMGEESDILDGHAYVEFLREYRDKLVPVHVPGPITVSHLAKPKGKPAQTLAALQAQTVQAQQSVVAALGVWDPSAGPRSKTLVEPAILWLEGSTAGSHPADDLLAFVWQSLDTEAQELIKRKRSDAIRGDGVKALLEEGEIKKGTPADSADYVMWLAKNYAQGGVRMSARPDRTAADPWAKKGVVFGDPLQPTGAGSLPYQPFDLYPPAEFRIPRQPPALTFDQQLDSNWAIGLVLDDVYPALRRGHGRTDAQEAAKELLLLSVIYHQLGGYLFAGPLESKNPCYDPNECQDTHALDRFIRFLGKEEADLLGGSVNLSRTGNYTTYMTYNPALFEVTRLFWPARRKDPSFHSLFSQSGLLHAVDAMGRYGVAATDTQKAAASSSNPRQVFEKLRALVAPGAALPETSESVGLILRGPGRGEEPQEGLAEYDIRGQEGVVQETIVIGQDPLGQPTGHFDAFSLLWPLGATMDEARDGVVLFATNPIEYLDLLKRSSVDPALNYLSNLRSAGFPRSESPLRRKKGPGSSVLKKVLRGKETIDPLEPEKGSSEYRVLLRQALRDAGAKLDTTEESRIRETLRLQNVEPRLIESYIEERRQLESESLGQFQQSPGNVLRRVSSSVSKAGELPRAVSRWESQPLLKQGEPPEWWTEGYLQTPKQPVYDAATIRMLAEVQESPRRPPSTLPPIFDDRYYAKKADEQAARWHGQHAIYQESAVSRVEEEKQQLADMVSSIDEAIRELDRKIEKEAGPPKPKPSKSAKSNYGRRPRRNRRR